MTQGNFMSKKEDYANGVWVSGTECELCVEVIGRETMVLVRNTRDMYLNIIHNIPWQHCLIFIVIKIDKNFRETKRKDSVIDTFY